MSVCVRAHTPVFTPLYLVRCPLWTPPNIHTHTYIHTYTQTHIHTHVHTYTEREREHIHTYTHTHTHTHRARERGRKSERARERESESARARERETERPCQSQMQQGERACEGGLGAACPCGRIHLDRLLLFPASRMCVCTYTHTYMHHIMYICYIQ